MCVGRATHQPTSNGGENIACRNKILIRGVSKTLPSVPFSPLAPRDESGGGRSLDGNNSTGTTKSEWNLSVGFPNSFVTQNQRARSARF
ncbi:hypothetical protein F2Q69_00036338 [Brassica cretica]|uniref:Uncharacterized protein n=1 Tax=Brassica cretica TaxID=69181 RepID=A0A8S9SMI3_BRACR|nr:hypothetical protein F2Q69_00036338 [Brassica cretica]